MTRPHLVTGEPTDAPEPTIYVDEAGATVWHGDCIETMTLLPADSIDAIVTDPPYGLEFMGREWDSFKPSGTVLVDPAEVGGFQDGNGGNPFSRSRIRYGIGHGFHEWTTQWGIQALRVLKPGGYLLAFGGSRTWHRLAAGLEDAGFEIRDSIAWMYAQGFPKSLNVTDAMADYLANGPRAIAPDERASYSRPGIFLVTGFLRAARDAAGWSNRRIDDLFGTNGMSGHWTSLGQQPAVPSLEQWARLKAELGFDDEVPAEGFEGVTIAELAAQLASTERPEDWGTREQQEAFLAGLTNNRDAEAARGWGTALKPAFEPIVVARKPLVGTYGANIRAYGVGGLNIEATRIGTSGGTATPPGEKGDNSNRVYGRGMGGTPNDPDFEGGRWPTNLVLSHAPECGPEDDPQPCVLGCPVRDLDEQGGFSRDGTAVKRNGVSSNGVTGWGTAPPGTPDAGGYGGSGGPSRMFPVFRYHAKAQSRERPAYRDEDGTLVMHPTVKPLALIRWLIRLVLRPGGVMLEPFAGSGTAVEAAILEGDRCIAIELGAEHLPLIAARLERQPSVVAERMERGTHVAPDGALW